MQRDSDSEGMVLVRIVRGGSDLEGTVSLGFEGYGVVSDCVGRLGFGGTVLDWIVRGGSGSEGMV